MCRKSYYHQKKHHHPKYGYWMAGNMERWAKHRKSYANRYYPPVNIQELDDRYEVFLFAPGLSKEDFEISLKDNILTISASEKEESEVKNGYWKRKEYAAGGFKRRFELNEKIDLEAIKAKYDNGILQLTLSKLEGETTFRKDIFVA